MLGDIGKEDHQYLNPKHLKKNLNVAGLPTSIVLNFDNGVFILTMGIYGDKPRVPWVGGDSRFFQLFLTFFYYVTLLRRLG